MHHTIWHLQFNLWLTANQIHCNRIYELDLKSPFGVPILFPYSASQEVIKSNRWIGLVDFLHFRAGYFQMEMNYFGRGLISIDDESKKQLNQTTQLIVKTLFFLNTNSMKHPYIFTVFRYSLYVFLYGMYLCDSHGLRQPPMQRHTEASPVFVYSLLYYVCIAHVTIWCYKRIRNYVGAAFVLYGTVILFYGMLNSLEQIILTGSIYIYSCYKWQQLTNKWR